MPDISFFDDDQVPQPRDKITINELNVQVYPDRYRVWIEIKVTPFQERPNLLLVARRGEQVVGDLSIIETMHANMEFTMHIRGVDDPTGNYTLDVELFYETRNPPQDRQTVLFTVEPAQETDS